ncbi:MAG: radical SAM protein, partial [Treponema sp.]|nr:radical SAM protein [Treponema sp.]
MNPSRENGSLVPNPIAHNGRAVLSGTPPEELAGLLAPLPRFRAIQIFEWIAKGAVSFDEMSSLPLGLREELKSRFAPRTGAVIQREDDRDGTVKLAVEFSDGAVIEAVLLTDSAGRKTACLSTQAGCPAGCVFCKTGSLGFSRNLDSSEIVEQFLLLQAEADHSGGVERGHCISNIVIMGMGEPLLNLAGLRRAIAVITAGEGLDFSGRRITISTCGIAEGIMDLAVNGPGTRMALSLTTADEALRQRLMPITASQPLNRVKEALVYFQHQTRR